MSGRRQKRAYTRKNEARHRIRPVWKKDFDEEAFAKVLLLLAMHLDEKKQLPHNKGQQTDQGGGNHE